MDEAQQAGVQGLAVKGDNGVRNFITKLLAGALASAAVERIANQRMAEFGEMDPDLVGSAGFEAAIDKACKGFGRGPEALQNLVMGAGVFAARLDYGHLLTVRRTAVNIAFNGACCRGHIAPDKGGIGTLNGVFLELSCKALVGRVILGSHDQATGVLVDPMNNPGAHDVANTG